MERRLVLLMFLSGLWFLPACVPRKYFLVEKPKTWSGAQSYCREKYTDLATVENQEEMDELLASNEDSQGRQWIGLHHEMTPWKWSLEDDSYYGPGEKEFRKWESGEPDQVDQDCVAIMENGFFVDRRCMQERHFVCYDGSGFVYVTTPMSWTDAQSYCREHFTDLAIVRNQTEYDQIVAVTGGQQAWIGLYRGQWKWSDGTPMSFRGWNPEPAGGVNIHCGRLNRGKWSPGDCNYLHYFVCYAKDLVKKQVVKIRVIQKDSSGSLEDAAEAILQEMSQKLKDHSLNEDVKLSWRKQPDGRVFVPEEEEEEEKKRKPDEL